MSATPQAKRRRTLVGCALGIFLLIFGGALLAFRWFSELNGPSNQQYLERIVFSSPTGQRELVMIYKRSGLDISRLFFVRDAPPNQKTLLSLERSHEPGLVVWSADGSVVATTSINEGKDVYDEAYDFRSHHYIYEVRDTPQEYKQRRQRIATLLKKRGGVAAPAARQNHPIGRDEQDQWRALDPALPPSAQQPRQPHPR